jgi:tRNA threonylcarbamoyladenosine biosynthesis protein TsaE
MSIRVEVVCSDLSQTDALAEKFSGSIENEGAFVCLYGNIGAGKTAFVKSVCKYLKVAETVTSPSFVILNEYKSGKLPVYHFDLYRLENEGISSVRNELEEYS